MSPDDKIYIAGHRGMVGGALLRHLQNLGYNNLVCRTSSELNLVDQAATYEFFAAEKPDVVVIAAAKVGGIYANDTYPAEFIFENLAIAQNCIHGAYQNGAKRVLFLGSSCIYPRMSPQPIKEDYLLTDALEKTNEAYALAKIAGLKLCEYYRKQYGVCYHSAMPTNLYGPGDNYHPENSHVMPALIRRFHEAREAGQASVVMWGTGKPRREFLHTDDLARALFHLLQLEDPPNLVNVGTGEDIPIVELAHMIAEVVEYKGTIEHDLSKPDGTPRKLLDVSRLKSTGWEPQIGLRAGIENAYEDFLQSVSAGTLRG